MVVPDTRIDKLFCEHSLVLGAPYIRFYVARPIHNSENVVIGSISLIDYASADVALYTAKDTGRNCVCLAATD